ncbi:SH3-domain-containing protein [Marasmius fiardii PR-910]|nr:SH3-domain-containing protein [Marasmius fiardii PR-910]
MVFANLSHYEKDAFFSLLDEYFQSRPELVAHLQGSASDGASSSEVKQATGRVAAAASAFANQSNSAPPRVPNSHAPPRGLRSSQISPPLLNIFVSLVKTFGDVDTSSKTKMVTSALFSKKEPQSSSPLPIPSAFHQKKGSFAPPPMRNREPTPPPAQQEEIASGEWAEALYDYDSSDPGDLQIRSNQRVLVTERTTDDWWTGTFNGKSGLFPASYVKLL